MTFLDVLFTWIAAGLTLAIFSFLYRDNPFYKFAEHIYVGSAAAYWFVYLWFFDVQPKLLQPYSDVFHKYGIFRMWFHLNSEQIVLFVPAVLSLFMLMRFIPRISWISRWAIAFTVGMGAGLGITGAVQGYIVPQVKAGMLPLWTGDLMTSINNTIIVISAITTLVYFFFSREHKGVTGVFARVGITFIMIAFGASFGSTIMARISLLIGRVYFLFHDWLHLV